jgi:hypothetical protein
VDRLGVREEHSDACIDEQLCLCLEALWVRFSPDQRCYHGRQNLAGCGYLVDHLGNGRRRGRVGSVAEHDVDEDHTGCGVCQVAA